jgi:pyruvate dehydrogenase E1 component alpha subunit
MLQPEKLIDMYEKMLTIRSFEEKAVFLFRSGVIGGAVHPSIGQEAVAVGTCENLSREDFVTSTHRGHGHCIAKGGDIRKMMCEIIGKSDGYCKGKGGSMHIADRSIGILGSNGIVGAGIPIAVGAAFRNIYKKESNRVVVCFFGDGGANQGSFHESLNMAAIWRLPVVFLCENNVWAISTRSDYASSGKSIGERACAYGIPGAVIDGNDVLAVYDAVNEAVGRCRSGEGPMLLECKTYRIEGHFVGDPRVYCKKEEVEDWKKRCPILAFEDYLFKNKMLTEEDSKSIRERVREKIEDAVQFAQNSPFPSIDTLEEDVYGFKADNS